MDRQISYVRSLQYWKPIWHPCGYVGLNPTPPTLRWFVRTLIRRYYCVIIWRPKCFHSSFRISDIYCRECGPVFVWSLFSHGRYLLPWFCCLWCVMRFIIVKESRGHETRRIWSLEKGKRARTRHRRWGALKQFYVTRPSEGADYIIKKLNAEIELERVRMEAEEKEVSAWVPNSNWRLVLLNLVIVAVLAAFAALLAYWLSGS